MMSAVDLKKLLSQVIFENEFDQSTLGNILNSCHEFQNLKEKDINAINQINSNLNSNKNVEQNYLLLNSVLLQCSEEVLNTNSIVWATFCVKGNDTFSSSISGLDYSNLYIILEKSHQLNDFKKQFISSVLSKFILKLENIPKCSKVVHEKLKCLEKVLKYFNGPCFSHYKAVERFLYQCLDIWHETESVVSQIGTCLALLTQLGGGGHQTSLYKENWKTQLCKLIKYTHDVLDLLLEDVPETQTIPLPSSILSLDTPVPFVNFETNSKHESGLIASQYNMRIFKNLTSLIQSHLVVQYPAPKTINIEGLLSVVSRCLSVSPSIISNMECTSDHALVLSVLPELHLRTHALLEVLIRTTGRNLIPYSLYICKLITHTMKWTTNEEGSFSLNRPFRDLRSQVYKTLHCWLTITGHGSNIELMADELVPYILTDITYEKPPVTLTTITKKPKRKNQKTKYGLEQDKTPDWIMITDLTNMEVCVQAHQVLTALIRNAGVFLKPEILQTIQTHIAELLFPLTSGGTVIPYSTCNKSRLGLYSSLKALVLYSNPKVPDVGHYANVFFHYGCNDFSTEIRSVCNEGIEILEKINHPKSDTLYFNHETLHEEQIKSLITLKKSFDTNKTENIKTNISSVQQNTDDNNKKKKINDNQVKEKTPIKHDNKKIKTVDESVNDSNDDGDEEEDEDDDSDDDDDMNEEEELIKVVKNNKKEETTESNSNKTINKNKRQNIELDNNDDESNKRNKKLKENDPTDDLPVNSDSTDLPVKSNNYSKTINTNNKIQNIDIVNLEDDDDDDESSNPSIEEIKRNDTTIVPKTILKDNEKEKDDEAATDDDDDDVEIIEDNNDVTIVDEEEDGEEINDCLKLFNAN